MEGSVWRAAGVLVAAGALRNLALLLRRVGLRDATAALRASVMNAGLAVPGAAPDTGITAH